MGQKEKIQEEQRGREVDAENDKKTAEAAEKAAGNHLRRAIKIKEFGKYPEKVEEEAKKEN